MGISAADYERYHRVPELYFRRVDRLLGDYRRLAEAAEADLVIASDHGFFWRQGRLARLSSLAAATAGQWHREEGIYLLWGPGVTPAAGAAGGHPERGGVAQVCATLLALLGLPPGLGVAGPPLSGTPAEYAPPGAAPVDYRAHFAPPAPPVTGPVPGAAEELAKLRALGYVGGGEVSSAPAGARAGGSTRTPASFNNEGVILEAAGRRAKAKAAFERALDVDPGLASASWNLSDLLHDDARDPVRSDALLVRALAAGLPDGERRAVARAREHRQGGRLEASVRLLAAAAAARPDSAELRLFLGRYQVEAGDCAKARADFDAMIARQPSNAVAYASQALARLCANNRTNGKTDLRHSLALDPNQPQMHQTLAELE